MKNTYQKRQQSKKHFVLIKGKKVIGVYGSFKDALDKIEHKDKLSYWTLIRDMPKNYKIGNYSLQVVSKN